MFRISFKALVVTIAAVALQFVAAGQAQAGFVLVTNSAGLGATDSIDWSGLPDFPTTMMNPFSVTSAGGVTADVGQGNNAAFQRRDQGANWNGNFANGAALLYTNGMNGPVIIDFANGTTVTAAGAQIQSVFYGPFTTVVSALAADGTSLASFTVDGTSNGNADNSAIFVGIQATGGDSFDKIVFSVTASPGDSGPGQDTTPQNFAIGQVDIHTVSNLNTVPAPAGVVLFALGMTGLGGFRLFRRKNAAATA